MYTRRTKKLLTHLDIREMLEAERVSKRLGKQLNTFVSLHPKFLRDYPDDIGKWVQDLLNNLRIRCMREGFGYFGVWVRENFLAEREEHLHLLLHIPASKLLTLEEALRRWLPGDDRVANVRVAKYKTTPFGVKFNFHLIYSCKQMTRKAEWGLQKRGIPVRRQVRSRTGLLVAPVLGKRCGRSRSLKGPRRQAFSTLRGIVFEDKCKAAP
jgi:hypothetical protein